MPNHQNDTLNSKKINLLEFFNRPTSEKQKQYEAVRAFVVDKLSAKEVAIKYSYQISTVYSLVKDARIGKLSLFPEIKKNRSLQNSSEIIQEKIVQHRNENLSSSDIQKILTAEGFNISVTTVERILKSAGFSKLKRRNNNELGITNKLKTIPERSENLDFSNLKPFSFDCPVVGVFFFLPYIIESGIVDIVCECQLPESRVIGATQACLAMLLLKLIGSKRLSHIDKYDQEPGFGSFAGLNVLPKAVFMGTYSCRTSERMIAELQYRVVKHFRKVFPQIYESKYINLDFHSIPHFGNESEMEKVWCGSRGKAMKGACTIFAQDGQSNIITYTRADILRKEEASEIRKFIAYWKKIRGEVSETLVFDCKFTKYDTLNKISEDGVKFITLRKRNQKLLEKTFFLPKADWKRVNLAIPKRKYCRLLINESQIFLKGCKKPFRQIIIKGNGRENPTFVITNNWELSLNKVLEIYAKRWRIENKLAELISFFNLNALSSPLMIRIHFDVLWSVIADTLYHRFAQDLRRFEETLAPTIFRKFIDMPGKLIYDGEKFIIKIRKRSHTPILQGVEKLTKPFLVPWLNNVPMEIKWTA